MDPYISIARILGTTPDVLRNINAHMSSVYGKDDAIEKLFRENAKKVHERLEMLEVRENRSERVGAALLKKIKHDDQALLEYFGNPACDTEENCREVLKTAEELANVPNGFFLKKEKARELLERNPPKNTLWFFKLNTIDELLNRYDLFEIYSALRFVEDKKWLNTVFFKQIEHLSPSDFEERRIKVHVLHKEWLHAAETFLEKKFHNVSHLKELGIIFVIPIPIDTPGEALRLFSLLLHYLHEITFYSKLFRRYAKHPDTFAKNLVSSLRGDVLDNPIPASEQPHRWMMVQRYLAKEDKEDPRLFASHVNPEAIHWTRAEDDIARLGVRKKEFGLDFWHGLDYIGDLFPDELGGQKFISFNLVDNAMSLVRDKTIVKYTYHHREALWNRLFAGYAGVDKMEELIIDNFSNGVIEI